MPFKPGLEMRQVLAVAVTSLVIAVPAKADRITCPPNIRFNGVLAQHPFGNPALAQPPQIGFLICIYTNSSYYYQTSAPHSGPCPAATVTAAVSGGTGTWHFGAPGSARTQPLPVVKTGHYCQYGSPSNANFPLFKVWRRPPGGEPVCWRSDPSHFVCSPDT